MFSLEAFGVKSRHLYVDKLSGKDFMRPAYLQMLSALRRDDVLVLPSIDRLGRNYEEIMNQWRKLTKEMQVQIVVLDMPLLDTRRKEKDELLDTFVADLVLQILSYVAQNEREMMRRRQREGIEAAKRKGVRFGRPPLAMPKKFDALYCAWKENNISAVQAAKQLGVAAKTFAKWVREAEHGMEESRQGKTP